MVKRISESTGGDDRINSTVARAARLADSGRPEEALSVLASISVATDKVRNARGVCLMRLGLYDEAIRVYRQFILHAGSTWMRPDLPVVYRVNFSTALLLAGLTSGGRSTLGEIAEQDHPSVVRLLQALDRWQRQLSWVQWMSWKCGLAPEKSVTLDFPPGEFVDQPVSPAVAPAVSADASSLRKQAL